MKMILSEKIYKYIPDINCEIVNEQAVDSLGVKECKSKIICGYAGVSQFLRNMPENIKMLIVTKQLKEKVDLDNRGIIVVENPQDCFWRLHQCMSDDFDYIRKKTPNIISENARIGQYVSIASNNVIIEDGVVIEDFVTIYENTHIKKNTTIHSGCRIGGVGFKEYKNNNGIDTINHYGGVLIGENVDIQNNSCVDKAIFPWDETIIGNETKIDNLVHIAHATKIGELCEIAAGTAVAGKCFIGNNVWLGLGTTIRNGVVIEENARVNIGSVVVNNIKEGMSVSGNYAMEHSKFLYTQLRLGKMK